MLPVGSTVHVVGEKHKVMILSRRPNIRGRVNRETFDYTGIIYSEGGEKEQLISFNRTDIEEIYSKGFDNPEEKALFVTFYEHWLSLEVAK